MKRIAAVQPEDGAGPTAAELAEIEREWPLIAAELALLDAEIAVVVAGDCVGVLNRRRVRRAERRVVEARRVLAADGVAASVREVA